MPKSLVGKVKNSKFAFFWLLFGGGIGNLLIGIYSNINQLGIASVFLVLLPSIVLSIFMVFAIANKLHRPKLWLGIDFILALLPVILIVRYLLAYPAKFGILFPDLMMIFGCILGIMDW